MPRHIMPSYTMPSHIMPRHIMPRHIFTAALLLIAAFATSVAPPALARDMTADEKAGLTAAVTDFQNAMSVLDFDRILAVTPPKITQHIAKGAGVSVEELRKMTLEMTKGAMAEVTIEEMAMDMTKATYAATSDGTPYALVPTRTVIKVGDTRMQSVTASLALFDEGAWRLIRVDEQQQIDILRQVYPGFKDIDLPKGEMKILE